jgi:hypothetical protein
MVPLSVQDKTLRAGTAPRDVQLTPRASQRASIPPGTPCHQLSTCSATIDARPSESDEESDDGMARAAQGAQVPSSDPQGSVRSTLDSALLSRRIGAGPNPRWTFRRHLETSRSRSRLAPSVSITVTWSVSGIVSSRSNNLQPGWGLPALVLPVNVHRASAAGSDRRQEGERLPSRGLTASSGRRSALSYRVFPPGSPQKLFTWLSTGAERLFTPHVARHRTDSKCERTSGRSASWAAMTAFAALAGCR